MVIRSATFITFFILSIPAMVGFGPDSSYDLGEYGWEFSVVQKFVVILLALTHIILSAIMWASRRGWLPSEASMFRFMSVKAVFWSYLAYRIPIRDREVDLVWFALALIMSAVTIDLDCRLFARYVMGREDHARGTIVDISKEEP